MWFPEREECHLSMMGPWTIAEFMLKKWLRLGNGHSRKTNHMVRGLGLWATWYKLDLLTSGEEREARDWVQSYVQGVKQSCLHNETSLKTLDTENEVSFLADEHIDVPGGWHI